MRPRSKTISHVCPACGAEASPPVPAYCSVCQKLMSEGYEPLDSIRSAHRLQRVGLSNVMVVESKDLFMSDEKNTASQLAWACFVYSLVPYLGILFIPLTFIFGVSGFLFSNARPELGGGSLAVKTMLYSVPVLAVQVLFWWLLYKIPEIAGV
jgi:hypothetical protein